MHYNTTFHIENEIFDMMNRWIFIQMCRAFLSILPIHSEKRMLLCMCGVVFSVCILCYAYTCTRVNRKWINNNARNFFHECTDYKCKTNNHDDENNTKVKVYYLGFPWQFNQHDDGLIIVSKIVGILLLYFNILIFFDKLSDGWYLHTKSFKLS